MFTGSNRPTRLGVVITTSNSDSKAGFILPEPDNDKEATKRNVEYFPSADLACHKCTTSLDLDPNMLTHFDVKVCFACIKAYPESFSLLTKTESKMDYLLTDSELKSLKFWTKPNPHKSSYANMLLYLRCQVEEFAFKKWGSPEGLDAEFEARKLQKAQRQEKELKRKRLELRRRTRTSILVGNSSNHVHEFIEVSKKGHGGQSLKLICSECGFEAAGEDF